MSYNKILSKYYLKYCVFSIYYTLGSTAEKNSDITEYPSPN